MWHTNTGNLEQGSHAAGAGPTAFSSPENVDRCHRQREHTCLLSHQNNESLPLKYRWQMLKLFVSINQHDLHFGWSNCHGFPFILGQVINHNHLRSLLSVSASRGPVFRRYSLDWWIDQNKTWAQGVSECDLIFRNILLSQNINFVVLPLAFNIKHGADSVQTK